MRMKECTWLVEDVSFGEDDEVDGLVACSLKENGISRREERSPLGKVKTVGEGS